MVYLVRPGENPELRYSLRSLANLPHGRVWLVGYRPRWAVDVEHVAGNRFSTSWLNVYDNLRLACAGVDAERFIVMNDDFFIVDRVDELPSWHRSTLAEHIARVVPGAWQISLQATLDFLVAHGFETPLSFELHRPVVMERAKLGEVLALAANKHAKFPPQWRSLYGNWWHVASTTVPDVKVASLSDDRRVRQTPAWQPNGGPFVSTDDRTFQRAPVGAWLRSQFPEPSQYEQAS